MLRHPGRPDEPDASAEDRDRLSITIIPQSHDQAAALSWLETTRWRVVSEVRRFATWATTRLPRLTPRACPRATLGEFVHTSLRALAVHPNRNRRVTRPTTPRTWVKLLALGLPTLSGAEHWREIAAQLTGYATLAPAPSTAIQRGVVDRWLAARDAVQSQFARTPKALVAAIWLSLELGRQGLRPKAAIRGAMSMARRTLIQLQKPSLTSAWKVQVVLDKDNKAGQVAAPRVRYIAKAPIVDLIMEYLPYDDYRRIRDARKKVLATFGVSQVYAARRDAAEMAEATGLNVAALLNHQPNSRHTPVYAGTNTPTSLCLALMSQR